MTVAAGVVRGTGTVVGAEEEDVAVRDVPWLCTLADRNVCRMNTNGFGLLLRSNSCGWGEGMVVRDDGTLAWVMIKLLHVFIVRRLHW